MNRKFAVMILLLLSLSASFSSASSLSVDIFFEGFDANDGNFEAPATTDSMAYDNKSAVIRVADSPLQSIRVSFGNIQILGITEMSFYWRYNISGNYTIGAVLKFTINNSTEALIGIILKSNGSIYVPELMHCLYGESNITHKSGKDVWNYFNISDISDFVRTSLKSFGWNIKEIYPSLLSFYVFSTSGSGYAMLDNVRLTVTINTPQSTSQSGISPIESDLIPIIIVIGLVVFVSVFLVIKKHNR